MSAWIVSGDYYDYIALSDRTLGVAIGDVSGQGGPTGLLMATCRSALRSLAGNCDSPAKALAAVYRQLFPDMREDMFISMVDMILEDESDRLRFARAGHEAPLMFRQATSEGEILKPGGLAIGIPSREGGIWGAVVGRG